jgi:uncharacterized membrane protein
MDASDIVEWLRGIARWVHVFAAILWIGQTYLFNWMEKTLIKEPGAKENVAGSLWMVHGGGFYLVEKQKLPELMPKTLHWFKWEAAVTWMSGVVLIALTYYFGGLLVEPEQNFNMAAGIGVGIILGGWLIYDTLVRLLVGKSEYILAGIGLVGYVALAYFLPRYMSSRAAYIHVGMVIGTNMAANVWMRILPAQRKMLALVKEGKKPDAALTATAPLRSKQNSFMVIPLVFIMISNHYPTISYGHPHAWAVLGGLLLAGWGAAKMFRR